jgi:flagellar FliJ protein
VAGKKFVLEQVLGYRREMENVRKLDFVSAKLEFESAGEILEGHITQLNALSKDFSQRQNELMSIEELRRYTNFFARKREDIKKQKDHVEQLDIVMNDRRDDLLVATKEKKVLESLKEKKAREHRQDMAQKERAFLDEISIQKKDESR